MIEKKEIGVSEFCKEWGMQVGLLNDYLYNTLK